MLGSATIKCGFDSQADSMTTLSTSNMAVLGLCVGLIVLYNRSSKLADTVDKMEQYLVAEHQAKQQPEETPEQAMSSLHPSEMIGRVDMLETKDAIKHWKAKGIDLSPLLRKPDVPKGVAIRHMEEQHHHLETILDRVLIEYSQEAIDNEKPVYIELPIHNSNRTVGTMLSSEIARKYGGIGLPEDTDERAQSSMGIRLMNRLANQLQSNLNVDKTSEGVRFWFNFK